jgi:exodeoxyribonuclease VII small subunit
MAEQKPTFESAMQRAEEIVARLERGDDSLEESLRMFEQAAELIAFCRGELDRAEGKLERLVKSQAGALGTESVDEPGTGAVPGEPADED